MERTVARTFWVELPLDVVLEVLQVVGTKLVDIYHMKIHWKIRVISLLMEIFNFLNFGKEKQEKNKNFKKF